MKKKEKILDFMNLLSNFTITEKIDELNIIFSRAASILNMDRIILYKRISLKEAIISSIFSNVKDEKIKISTVVNIKENINVYNSFISGKISKIPIPDEGEDIAISISNNEYVLAADDINEARETSTDEHIYFTFLAKATENALNNFYAKKE